MADRMMTVDRHEQTLINTYNAAVARRNAYPRGDPRHTPACRDLIRAASALQRYRKARMN
jgi:hypothetical protein